MWNNIKESFVYSVTCLREIFYFSIILFIVSTSISGIALKAVLLNLFVILLATAIIMFIFGRKRLQELENISLIIKSIRKDKFNSAEEIKLGEHLGKLETEIKKMFLRTQNDIAHLKKLELARTEFLGNVSHELRTPIFTIQGYLETLLDGALGNPAVNKNFIQKALNHTENLNDLLNDLIDISMIESGQMRLSFRFFNVADHVQEVINEYIPFAEKKGLKIELKIAKPGLKLFGDRDRLKQVIGNLISNAIKYTENGKIEILIEEEGKFGKISVKDTGCGIPADEISRVFERFYRTEKARNEGISGTGLGLAIVKHIVEAHGSKVLVESEPGKGSVFSFMLKR